jgi:outer membrane protein assembly factor BamB
VVFAQDMELGLVRWQYQTGAGISANPVMAGPSLVVANDVGNVLTFNPETGGLLWRKDTFGRVSAAPAATDRLIYVPSQDQSLYAFVRNTGNQAWRYYATDPLTEKPFLAAGLVIQRVPEEGLVALDENTGELVWKVAGMSDARPLMIRNDNLYVHHRDEIVVVAARDGGIVQRVKVPAAHVVLADPAAGGAGDLYVIRLNGPIMKLTPR